MPQYDSAYFDPPAPVALVTLLNPMNDKAIYDVPMLLDTGADTSLLPRIAVERLGIQIDNSTSFGLVAFDGTRSVSGTALTHLVLLSNTFKGKFLLRDDVVGVIGRDILNHLSLRLNGRQLTWDLELP
jgi:hypothetical protein